MARNRCGLFWQQMASKSDTAVAGMLSVLSHWAISAKSSALLLAERRAAQTKNPLILPDLADVAQLDTLKQNSSTHTMI